MDGRRCKEKDLMVARIGFYMAAAALSGWMVLCKAGWLGLGGDNKPTFLVSSNSTLQQSRRALHGQLEHKAQGVDTMMKTYWEHICSIGKAGVLLLVGEHF